MPTIEELGKLVKQKYPGSYDSVPDADLGKQVQQKYPGSYDQYTTAPTSASQTWADKLGITSDAEKDPRAKFAKAAVDFAEGMASGAASTVFHGGDLLRRMTGSERVIDNPEVKQAMAAPPGIAGTAGRLAEQMGEYVIPGGVAAKAGKALGMGMAGRAALEGLTAGAVGAAQGGTPGEIATTAALGAAGPVVEGAIPAAAQLLKENALKQYSQFLNPRIADKAGTAKIVPELLDREVKAFTLRGFRDKAAAAADEAGSAINVKWANLPPDTVADSTKLVSDINSAIGEHYIKGFLKSPEVAKPAITALEGLRDTIENISINGKIEVKDLLGLRRYWDGIVDKAGGFGKPFSDTSTAQAHKQIANSAREILNSDHPDIAALNHEFNLYKTAEDVATATIERRTGQAKSLGRKMTSAAAAAAGFGSGGVHGAIAGKVVGDALEALVESPAWKTVAAVYKNKLADSLAIGDQGAARFYLAKIKNVIQGATTSQDNK